jgi:4-hydroxy-4-methyl-2-oxoglutarate aldolase
VIDLALFRTVAYSAVVSDCCDQVGLRGQTLEAGLHPIAPGQPVIVGYARPVRSAAVERVPDVPYATEVAYIDSLVADDVVVAVTDPVGAFWGELFSTAAVARGAAGAVIDGLVRDTRLIVQLGWPMLARGTRPTDSLGRMSIVEWDVPVEILGVTVARGDLVVADVDGTVIVPAAAAEEVVARAVAKASTESSARAMLRDGAFLRDAWERFRVL